ncbi:UNVERIFIED_CONTAM: hypothetical protein GTU68_014756 [Idotea baltica]|nr:hypothetical protein [Idotea baltica]
MWFTISCLSVKCSTCSVLSSKVTPTCAAF